MTVHGRLRGTGSQETKTAGIQLRSREAKLRANQQNLALVTSLFHYSCASLLLYSYLRAAIGSTRIARMAGTNIAAMAINASNTATQTKLIGS